MSRETEVHLPRDLENLVECRRLAVALGGESGGGTLALAAIWRLFRELATNARPESLGLIEQRDVPLYQDSMPKGVTLDHLAGSGLLVVEGAGMLCPLFIRHNQHLVGRTGLDPSLGGMIKEFNRQVKAAREGGSEELALLPPDTFVDAGGQKLDSETIKHVRMVLVAMDNATGRAVPRNPENPADWPADTVRAAVTVLKSTSLTNVVDAVRDLKRFGMMDSPAIPRTTEAMLQRFPNVLSAVLQARKRRQED